MFLNITNGSFRLLCCVTVVLLLPNLLPVKAASINKSNSWFEKKLNFTCLQMDTWDCFNLNRGYFQNTNTKVSERMDKVGYKQIVSNKGTSMRSKAVNTDTKSMDNLKNSEIVQPYFYIKPVDDIRAEVEDKKTNDDISMTYKYASSDHPRSSRTSRKLGQLSREVPENVAKETTDSENRYMEIADSLWSSSFRTTRISRKMWMAILAGIILKFASLLPLILGKFALMGTISIVASKLSLLIVAIMAMRQIFTADVKGFGAFPDLGFNSHHHEAMGHHQQYPDHQHGHAGHYPQALPPHSYHPAMAMSYAHLHHTAPGVTHKKLG